MSVYMQTLKSIGNGYGITTTGDRLAFTGNRQFMVGDSVWTDGKYIYGLQGRHGGNMLMNSGSGILVCDDSMSLYYIDVINYSLHRIFTDKEIHCICSGKDKSGKDHIFVFINQRIIDLVSGKEREAIGGESNIFVGSSKRITDDGDVLSGNCDWGLWDGNYESKSEISLIHDDLANELLAEKYSHYEGSCIGTVGAGSGISNFFINSDKTYSCIIAVEVVKDDDRYKKSADSYQRIYYYSSSGEKTMIYSYEGDRENAAKTNTCAGGYSFDGYYDSPPYYSYKINGYDVIVDTDNLSCENPKTTVLNYTFIHRVKIDDILKITDTDYVINYFDYDEGKYIIFHLGTAALSTDEILKTKNNCNCQLSISSSISSIISALKAV